MSESKQTRQLCTDLRGLGCLVRVLSISRYQEAGWPDRWLACPWWHGHLEFKGAGGKLTKLQQIRLKQLHEMQPYTALVVRFIDSGFIQIELWNGEILFACDSAKCFLERLKLCHPIGIASH
jgi:hypothetical protein